MHRSTTSGFTPAAGNRIAQPTTAGYVDTGLAAGTYYYKVIAADANGNLSAPSAQASAVITATPPVGLVAAYGFDEGSGTTVADSSGSGNGGTVSGATWAIGKFGTALSFDGVNDIVNVADSASLDLTTGMTIEAWVLPRALGSDVEDGRTQGAERQLRLRPLRQHRHQPSERQRRQRRHRPRPARAGSAAARHVGARRGDV